MSIYVIGDIQGCFDSLIELLEQIEFNQKKDQLWFAGDLVNRGPKSLETLRFIKALGSSATCVLGNHDISLIAMHYGALKSKSLMHPILTATDNNELIQWLQNRPLLHVDHQLGCCLSHAGVYPNWTLNQAIKFARETEQKIKNINSGDWLKQVYGNHPEKWASKLTGIERDRFIINAFTRMRYVDKKKAKLDFQNTLPPMDNNKQTHLVPWFAYKKRKQLPVRSLFGHWASLGYFHNEHVTATDTGCVWSNQLTAVCLDDGAMTRISVDCTGKVDG